MQYLNAAAPGVPPLPQPVCTISEDVVNGVFEAAKIGHRTGKVPGLPAAKRFYNRVYQVANERFSSCFRSVDPAGRIFEAYKQLMLWTVVYHSGRGEGPDFGIVGPADIAPIARSGWRYVIEKGLEVNASARVQRRPRPSPEEVEEMFTLILLMGMAVEWSDYLHYFEGDLKSIEVGYELESFFQPNLSNEDATRFYEKLNYLMGLPPFGKYPEVYEPFSDKTLNDKISHLVLSCFGFDLSLVLKAAIALRDRINPHVLITVHSFEYIANWIAKELGTCIPQINRMLDFILLSSERVVLDPRDFTSKSQQNRMLNHCGVMLSNLLDRESVYDPDSAANSIIMRANRHVIISPVLMGEWGDVFRDRLAHGKRTDLKQDAISRQLCGDIEDHFHRRIFEQRLYELVSAQGLATIRGLSKVGGGSNPQPLPCGEIDLLAYNAKREELLVVETKALAGIVDAKSRRQCFDDHFTQKRYHDKFLKKIEWVRGNLQAVRAAIAAGSKSPVGGVRSIRPYFVTLFPNIVKYHVTDYKVMTLDEFMDHLKQET